ncbi:MAG: hypothetical protein DELT_02910 [Desulfovibrio sp.]
MGIEATAVYDNIEITLLLKASVMKALFPEGRIPLVEIQEDVAHELWYWNPMDIMPMIEHFSVYMGIAGEGRETLQLDALFSTGVSVMPYITAVTAD